ncbi:GNAT superfamily N-acetyltransferase [Sphingomonas zeicaulis]|uniref:GNAT family N-acetyltransferase n=1 Tax=Sphingomonas zeicaulis TaxID=1632740 RepID=UPI003D208CFE
MASVIQGQPVGGRPTCATPIHIGRKERSIADSIVRVLSNAHLFQFGPVRARITVAHDATPRKVFAVSSTLTWRFAEPQDVDAINAMTARSIRALHSDSYEERIVEEAISHAYGVDWQLVRDRTYFVVEIDGDLAGAGGWSYRETIAGAHGPNDIAAPELDRSRDAARIRAFYVDPAFVRRGVGALLVQVSEKAAHRAGFKKAELTSTLPAVPFYAAAGYREAGAFDMSLPSGSLLRLIKMEKALSPNMLQVE